MRELGFDVRLRFCDAAAGEEEHGQESKEGAPRVQGVGASGDDGSEYAEGCEGVVGVGAVGEGEDRGDGDVGLHCGIVEAIDRLVGVIWALWRVGVEFDVGWLRTELEIDMSEVGQPYEAEVS